MEDVRAERWDLMEGQTIASGASEIEVDAAAGRFMGTRSSSNEREKTMSTEFTDDAALGEEVERGACDKLFGARLAGKHGAASGTGKNA